MSVPFQRVEHAPVLLVFGEHAGRVAGLLHARPSLVSRMAFAPRPAIHAIGAYLHLCPDADRPDSEVAATLDERSPRYLLRTAIPSAPSKLYRALNRAGDQVKDKSYYERLATLSVGPLAEILLSDGNLDDALLNRIETLSEIDSAVLSSRSILDRRLYEVQSIDVLIRFLRAHGAFVEDEFRLPDGAGLPAVKRRLQKALDRIEAPMPSFGLPAPFRILRTIGELREVGRNLQNCVQNLRWHGNDHWFRLASGSAVYVAGDSPPLLAALDRAGPDLWRLDELCGPRNATVDATTKAMLIDALQEAGVRLLRDSRRMLCRS